MKAVKTWVLIVLLCITAINVYAWPIPDTGQTLCYDAAGAVIACPAPGQAFYGQDGNYTIDPPSYTKLDAGVVLADDTATWAMVKDNVTGLIWENKTSDGSIHDGAKKFTWCDTNTATNRGNQGTCGTGTGNAATDTKAYIKALNDANFGGFSDWRLPSVNELGSIVDGGRFNPSINTAWFSSTVPSYYWSSTTNAVNTDRAWLVLFYDCYVSLDDRSNSYYVRAVRGGQSGSLDHLVINGDGTVTDTDTGLMWQQGTPSPATMTWDAALSYAEGLTLAGYDDWRLPTPKEFQSIVDYNRSAPAIDTALFPGTVSSYYWSSTTHAFDTHSAWLVSFGYGDGLHDDKSYSSDVRAVRAGQSLVLGHLALSEPSRAASWNIGEQKTITWDTALIGGNVKISLSRQGGKTGTFTEIIAESAPNSGFYTWTVTGPSSVNCVLRIEPLSDGAKATTQGLFSITPSTIAITSVQAMQRTGTQLVDITYDLAYAGANNLNISVQVSDNGGATYAVPATSFSGDGYGAVVQPGTGEKIVWDAGADWNQQYSQAMRFKVVACDGVGVVPTNMVLIPAGSFQMGDDGLGFAVHTVTLSAFYLDRYEVTKALWDEVYTWATANGYTFDNAGAGTTTTHPVQTVSWYDVVKWLNARSAKEGRTPVYYTDSGQATVYRTGQVDVAAGAVKWSANGYRLPTEAEWEYAARAGTTTRYYTGNCISPDTQANFNGTLAYYGCPTGQYRGATTVVGSFPANPWGLYDMAGNIWEWTWDWWYEAYSSSTVTNPQGPAWGWYRVSRGGGWYNYTVESASRDVGTPSYADGSIGFRSALRSALCQASGSVETNILTVDTTGFTLSVTRSGSGVGRITNQTSEIDCGSSCNAIFGSGQSVTLTATPGAWAAFTGWSGGVCSGTSPICQVTMDGAKSVTAIFTAIVESTPPILVITKPANNAVVTSLYEIGGTVMDASPSSGLKKVELQVKGSDFYLTNNPAEWWSRTQTTLAVNPTENLPAAGSLSWNWLKNTSSVGWLNDTRYTITATATDQAGNASTTTSQFAYCTSQTYTTLSMDLSSRMILNGDTVEVSGQLLRLPNTDVNMKDYPIKLKITAPDETVTYRDTQTDDTGTHLITTDDTGHYLITDVSGFTLPGSYKLQAEFVPTGCLFGSTATAKNVIVGKSAGYAVIVEGRIANDPEGQKSHNKTTNRIYKKLIERGFADANIKYFNYVSPQPQVVIEGVYTKDAVRVAITDWAKTQMNLLAAPLYIIMVDHGNKDAFYLDSNATIIPGELALWLDALEDKLDDEAKAEKRVVVIGACYSGSFIPALSKPGSNRVIVTSATADEQSYKGLIETDETENIRSGEYFLDEFFVQLSRGYSFKKSFQEAAKKTREFTHQGGVNAPMNKYFDTSVQHPLLDDNGDGKGSNLFTEGMMGDGMKVGDFYLGIGPTYNTNAPGNQAEITEVTPTVYLEPGVSAANLWLRTNVISGDVRSAGLMIRPPGPIANITGSTQGGTDQLFIDLETQFMSYEAPNNWWKRKLISEFSTSGIYEIFYYVRDSVTGDISPLRRSVLYKKMAGNSAPNPFTLGSPADGVETKTTLIFRWNPAVVPDPDGDPVTYNLVITDESGVEVYRREGITTTLAIVDQSANLHDKTNYYWYVEAVDSYGNVRPSTSRLFTTNNKNYIPGIIQGVIFSDQASAMIAAATVKATIGSDLPVIIQSNLAGNFALEVRPGDTVKIECVKTGYQTASLTNMVVPPGEITTINIPLSVSAGPGDLNGDTKVDLADAILALKVVSGITSTVHKEADLNSDGKIGMADVIFILQKAAELR